MTNKEKEDFLKKHFKAGEYASLTMFVRLDEITRLMDILNKSSLNLAIMPDVKATIDFEGKHGTNATS